jgi:excinuclease ABC subunit C
MGEAAEGEQFETAAHYRDLIRSIEGFAVRQKFTSVGLEDQDYFAHYREGERASLQVFQMREGVVASRREFSFEGPGDSDAGFLAAGLQQYYTAVEEIPGEIYVPEEPAERALLEDWLGSRRGSRVRIHAPRRGPRRALVETVAENARLAFESTFRAGNRQAVEEAEGLREALGLEESPLRIEAFDISNLQGTDSVASMVVWEAGKMRPSEYRQFRIRSVQGADDFASLAEAVGRRYARLLREGKDLPDLVLIDGGKGQLASAAAALDRLDLATLNVAAIAKREEVLTVKGKSEEIRLEATSPALHLVQRIRDEAHRFAVRHHQKLRSRRTLTSDLMSVPGIGVSRARRLLRVFGSVKGILAAPREALIKEVGPALAGRIHARLGEAAPPPGDPEPGPVTR